MLLCRCGFFNAIVEYKIQENIVAAQCTADFATSLQMHEQFLVHELWNGTNACYSETSCHLSAVWCSPFSVQVATLSTLLLRCRGMRPELGWLTVRTGFALGTVVCRGFQSGRALASACWLCVIACCFILPLALVSPIYDVLQLMHAKAITPNIYSC